MSRNTDKNELPKNGFRPLCFVIGPIGTRGTVERQRSDMLLRYIIHPVLSETYSVRRADEDARPGLITQHVIQDIYDAELILADLSRLNPNAFYELGVAHALAKKIIHLCDTDTELPFDIRDYRAVFFDPMDPDSHENAKIDLRKHSSSLDEIKNVSNPVISAIGRKETIDKEAAAATTISQLFEDVDNIKKNLKILNEQSPLNIMRENERAMKTQSIVNIIDEKIKGVKGMEISHRDKTIRISLDKRFKVNAAKAKHEIGVLLEPLGFECTVE